MNPFIELAQGLGKPLVMRMNLNQQSAGPEWATHKAIMATTSPLVDCGVHYVDVMSQMTNAQPVSVHAIAALLTDELAAPMYNYGQLQVIFDDGSVGWYEAGWGPMMSETAFFIKDVIGPNGSVSIESGFTANNNSSDVNIHTATNKIRCHSSALDPNGTLRYCDELIDTHDEPTHDELCRNEQQWFLDAVLGDVDTAEHLDAVVQSLKIVSAADRSIQEGQVIKIAPLP